jgi:hypothetical protein
MQTIQELGLAMQGTALATQYLNALLGHGELDSSAMVLIQEKMNDLMLNN